MEDKKMKQANPAKEVKAALSKAKSVSGNHNNPGSKSSPKRSGTNRGYGTQGR